VKRRPLKAPFPYFGGKSRVAALVWSRLGPVSNYIEPFFGSGANLLGRPDTPKIETVNDLDCYVANFWRATQHDPEAVATFADGPVNETDLHSRHRWLVLSDDAAAFRRRMRTEPEYYDAKVAGWWCWGLCCWIGSGWCTEPGLKWEGRGSALAGDGEYGVGRGVNSLDSQGQTRGGKRVKLSGGSPDSGALGTGVHSNGPREQLPSLTGMVKDGKRGICYGGSLIHQDQIPDTNRPQLADAFSHGRGVHGNDNAGTCARRRAWLLDWFGRLRDRLRQVRVCCGPWLRVCDSPSVTTRLGTTGLFFDPPYGTGAGRNAKLYAQDSLTVAADVRAYCLERGADPLMRIALAGYEGEGHEPLEAAGWEVVAWTAHGGYGNRSARGKANAKKERLWFSPHCQREQSLFGAE
jgi:hypothetical protein